MNQEDSLLAPTAEPDMHPNSLAWEVAFMLKMYTTNPKVYPREALANTAEVYVRAQVRCRATGQPVRANYCAQLAEGIRNHLAST